MKIKEFKETLLYTPAKKTQDAVDFYFSFPGEYKIGMSALGYLSLCKDLDESENVILHRIFTDSLPNKIDTPSLLGFPFSFELDFLQIFSSLDKMAIPILKKDRKDSKNLIFSGGPVISVNPEPFAEVFDFFIIGDGDKVLIEVANIYKNSLHLTKDEIIKELSSIEGIYIPDLFEIDYQDSSFPGIINNIKPLKNDCVRKISLDYSNKCIYSSILTEDTIFSNTFLIEVERGCSQKCLFCIASYLNGDVRYPTKDKILKAIDLGLQHTNKIGLLGALITEHPDFNEIMEYISELNNDGRIHLTTSSLRADQVTSSMAKILSSCNQKQITISLEAGSERLRNKLNKNLTNQDIINCLKNCEENGIKSVKLYAMVGLPSETEEDINALIEFMKQLKQSFQRMEITLSINSFIPKARTPFEKFSDTNFDICKEKMALIKKQLLKQVKVRTSSTKWDRIQAIVSRGNRNLLPLLIKSYRNGGSLGSFNNAFRDIAIDITEAEARISRSINTSKILPWSHIRF